jgi:hypothetical protein
VIELVDYPERLRTFTVKLAWTPRLGAQPEPPATALPAQPTQ